MDDQLQQILSQQLRDVHTPETISWWPLAIAWWVLALLVVMAIGWLIFTVANRYRKNRYRKQALIELSDRFSIWQSDQDSAAYLQSVNVVLKRSIIQVNKQSSLLTLSGKNWVTGLNGVVNKPLPELTQEALAHACYQAKPSIDIVAVNKSIQQWLRTHQRERLARGSI